MNADADTLYLYWIETELLAETRARLRKAGFRLGAARLTACQVLKATGDRVLYAGPDVWNRICSRQGSWYRVSRRAGQTMMVSARRLPADLDKYLEAEIRDSDFRPDRLPSEAELERLTIAPEYLAGQPEDWEQVGPMDAVMFKALFGVTGFWARGDNLERHWIGHRANHANFLAKRFTTEIEGEQVPYSVTTNKGVCSSCAELFNVLSPESRKLVQACPGAAIFGGAPKDKWIDVRPVQNGAPR